MRILDELSHNLQLAVLEPFVLEDLLDGHDLPRLHDGRLEDDAERPVADDALGGVRYGLLPVLPDVPPVPTDEEAAPDVVEAAGAEVELLLLMLLLLA